MIYRRFGKTGLRMPVLSAGFMRAMHSWKRVPARDIPAASQANLEDIVSRALELGIDCLRPSALRLSRPGREMGAGQ